MVFPASIFPDVMFESRDTTLVPMTPIFPLSALRVSPGFPSAFVDAGGGLGGGVGGIVPLGGLGISVASADLESGILCLYFTEEFQPRQPNLFL